MTDETHDKARQSWVASANGHSEFPLQNLPFGVQKSRPSIFDCKRLLSNPTPAVQR